VLSEAKAWDRLVKLYSSEEREYWGMCRELTFLYYNKVISDLTYRRMISKIEKSLADGFKRPCWPFLFPPGDYKARARYARRRAAECRK